MRWSNKSLPSLILFKNPPIDQGGTQKLRPDLHDGKADHHYSSTASCFFSSKLSHLNIVCIWFSRQASSKTTYSLGIWLLPLHNGKKLRFRTRLREDAPDKDTSMSRWQHTVDHDALGRDQVSRCPTSCQIPQCLALSSNWVMCCLEAPVFHATNKSRFLAWKKII